MSICRKVLRKIKTMRIKMLSASAKKYLAKAYALEDKAIMMELELKEQRI